jgi:ribosomal protein L40E
VSAQPSGPEQPAQFTAPTKVCPNCGAQAQTTADKCPNCGKKYKQKKGGGCLKTLLFGFLGLIVLIIVIAVAAGGGGDSDGGDSGSDSESGKSGKVGQALTNAGTTYKVTDVQTTKTIGNPDLAGARADGTFVVVSLELTNNKDETKTFTEANAKIQTSDDKQYETSDKAVLSFGDESLLLKDIQPDLTAHGKLAFDLPPSKLSGSTLIIEDLFGSGEIKVDLGL